ncbi:MAG: hypothetical protein ACRD1Y_03200 [Terriglobales bacterium]
MKTTLIIPDTLYRSIKQRAVAQRRSISAIVSEYLQAGLRRAPQPDRTPPPLPCFDLGLARVDVSDRDALERAMRFGDRDPR